MLHSDLEALVGEVLHDRYQVESLLGTGGMGAVFKAHHTGLDRDVAIKVLHPEIGRDASVSKRFDREATSASRLDHPNCVRVTDFGTTDSGVKYLVMEMLEGGELLERLDHPWPPAQMIDTATQILAGLEHAHHFGIVHRDLKPENVFVTTDFRGDEVVKLVDFGIAKLLDEQGTEKLTRQGVVFGTPRYMSPEQAAGGKIDERTDLYAAGLIFYEMLAGRPPFEADDAAQLLRMQIMAPPPPLPDSVPPQLAAIVEKLLEKSKMDRYASAREVIDALDAIRDELSGAAAAAGLGAAAAATAPTQATLAASTQAISPATAGATLEQSAHSGVAWQPAGSGAVGQTQAYSSGQHLRAAPLTGAHAGVGEMSTGPFESLASGGAAMSASNPAGWTGSQPALANSGAASPSPADWTGSHPSLAAGQAGLSAPGYAAISAPGSAPGYASVSAPEQTRSRSWLPWAIAGFALVAAAGAFGLMMLNRDDGTKQAESSTEASGGEAGAASSSQAPAVAGVDAEADGGATDPSSAQASGQASGQASDSGNGVADPRTPPTDGPESGPSDSDAKGDSIWSRLNDDSPEADGGSQPSDGGGGPKTKPSTEDPTRDPEPDASGDTTGDPSAKVDDASGKQDPSEATRREETPTTDPEREERTEEPTKENKKRGKKDDKKGAPR